MKKIFRCLCKTVCWLAAGIVFLLLLGGGILWGLYASADMGEPVEIADKQEWQVVERTGYRECRGSYFRKSESGLYEVFLDGGDYERGRAFGCLMPELLYYQEKVFVDRIRELIPSESYLKFLRFFTVLFNRNLGEYVPEEYRREIYGISRSATHEFDWIGNPYERSLNYHAAHDIGHAMQDYMLVGCSSFGLWGSETADSALLIGRNFDFYVGEDFARHKLVAFYRPEQGYRFASVGWAGMTGVLSGMNETGLTVTLNAAKSSVPLSAATPISVLAREILQYASTIEEAYAIARKRKTFVAESILIGSAKDGEAALIEKSPGRTVLFRSDTTHIFSTNHYQSEAFREDPRNRENIATSDSPYRYRRLEELISTRRPLQPEAAAAVLRDYKGLGDQAIGLANEKAINQFIAHHSVIFQPARCLMWVSTAPWQLGKYVAYDLNRIFSRPDFSGELYEPALTIAADSFLFRQEYQDLMEYRRLCTLVCRSIREHQPLEEELVLRLIRTNPQHYYVYELAGDYYAANDRPEEACRQWEKALTREIPKTEQRNQIQEKLKKRQTHGKNK